MPRGKRFSTRGGAPAVIGPRGYLAGAAAFLAARFSYSQTNDLRWRGGTILSSSFWAALRSLLIAWKSDCRAV